MMERGCISELTRPYTTTYAAGPLTDREPLFYINGYEWISLERMKEYLRNTGPIAITVDWIVNEMDDIGLSVEVYNGPDNVYDFIQNDVIGHMLVVIGYGAELIRGERVEFWIVQNSHGVAWGENGYGRFNVNITLPTGEPFISGGLVPGQIVRERFVNQKKRKRMDVDIRRNLEEHISKKPCSECRPMEIDGQSTAKVRLWISLETDSLNMSSHESNSI
ncbi:Papain family cysteine protease [Trifolium repens]|nr:Papain family cysteine protease [Trifolium repens]